MTRFQVVFPFQGDPINIETEGEPFKSLEEALESVKSQGLEVGVAMAVKRRVAASFPLYRDGLHTHLRITPIGNAREEKYVLEKYEGKNDFYYPLS